MSRASRSRKWFDEHRSDAFVKKARATGARSRAAFKLEEIAARDQLLRPGMVVLDLGAAPGGWSQHAASKVGDKGLVVAVDRLEMPALAGVEVVLGDMEEEATLAEVRQILGPRKAGLVMSDMAPNLTGVRSRDEAVGERLGELAVEMAEEFLAPQGNLLVKTFHGRGFELLRGLMRERFARVSVRKPEASRDRSSEIYLVAKGFGV